MIATTKIETGLAFRDESEALKRENGAETLALVQAAMRAGLMEFTTPTIDDDEKRIDWKVRKWVTLRSGKLVCFLVAYKEFNAHFEILGPELANGGTVSSDVPELTEPKIPQPQKR